MPNSHERAGVGEVKVTRDKILRTPHASSSCLVSFVEAMALDARIAPNARIQVLHCFHEGKSRICTLQEQPLQDASNYED